MKVHVPKELKPPHRFKPVYDATYKKWFVPSGQFGVGRPGEFFWDPTCWVDSGTVQWSSCRHPRVIMIPCDRNGKPL